MGATYVSVRSFKRNLSVFTSALRRVFESGNAKGLQMHTRDISNPKYRHDYSYYKTKAELKEESRLQVVLNNS